MNNKLPGGGEEEELDRELNDPISS